MVKEIKAYEASDGKLFASRHGAAKHDAVLALAKLNVFNHGSALAVVENAGAVVDALQPLLWAADEEATDAKHD